MSSDTTQGTTTPQYCPSCQAPLEAGQCMACSTPLSPGQASGSAYWQGLKKELFNHGRKIRWTTWNLLGNPRKVIQSWVEKQEKKAMHPIRYLFVTAGMNILIARWLQIGHGSASGDNEIALLISGWISQYFNFVWVAIIPAMAIGPWILERKRYPTYPTHLVVVTYMTAINCLLTIPFFLIEWAWADLQVVRKVAGVLVPMVYNIWLFRQSYQAPVLRTMAMVLLSWGLGILSFMILYVVVYLGLSVIL